MKTLRICVILLLFHSGVWAQPNLDSLWQVWQDESQPDTSRLRAIEQFARSGYMISQPDSALYFARLGYDFAKEKGLKKEMAKALVNQGTSLGSGGDGKALEYYKQSLKISEEIGDKKSMAHTLIAIGVEYIKQVNYTEAFDNYNRSLEIMEEFGSKDDIIYALLVMAIFYENQQDYAKVLYYYTRCLKINEEVGDKYGIAQSLQRIGRLYKNQGNYALALDHYTRCLKVYDEIDDNNGLGFLLEEIGNIYKDLQEYAQAIDYYSQSIKVERNFTVVRVLSKIGDIYEIIGDYDKAVEYHNRGLKIIEERGVKGRNDAASSLVKIGIIYTIQGQYVRALDYLGRAFSIAQEKSNIWLIRDAAEALWEAHKKYGNYQQSLEMHELYIAMRDSVDSKDDKRKLARFDFKYEFDKKTLADSLRNIAKIESLELNHQMELAKLDHIVELAQKETERNLYASAGLFLLFITFLFYQRKVNKNKLVLKEKEAAYQQELIYASINSQENERRRIARDLHDEVGAMLSALKLQLGAVGKKLSATGASEDPTKPAVSLVDETISNVRRISKDLLPPTLEEFGLAHALEDLADKVASASGIVIKKDIQPLSQRLEVERELALYRVIQEMMNNALKHSEASEFSLAMHEKEGRLHLSFSDNGKGFDVDAIKKSKAGKTGLGLKNLENRVGAAGGSMQFTSRPGGGTKLEVTILHNNSRAA